MDNVVYIVSDDRYYATPWAVCSSITQSIELVKSNIHKLSVFSDSTPEGFTFQLTETDVIGRYDLIFTHGETDEVMEFVVTKVELDKVLNR